MIRRQIERYGIWVALILGLMLAAALATAFLLANERFQSPFANRYTVKALFANANGVTPGLGRPVNVSGVKVGEIVGVELNDGLAEVKMSIDPGVLPEVHRGARADLVPNTPLQDMQVELYPGPRSAPALADGATLANGQTSVPVVYDDLTSALDGDTRQYLGALVTSLGQGLHNRGHDLRAALRALGPTTGQLRDIGDLLAARRNELARVVHNLALLSHAASQSDADLARTVSAGDATVGAVASQQGALAESVNRLPGVVSTARGTLADLASLSRQLRPGLQAMLPSARRLPQGLGSAQALLDDAVPLLRQSLPSLRLARTAGRSLTASVNRLAGISPHLQSVLRVLQYATNELSYNPPGADEGYLYWLAWGAHNTNSVVSTEDANGAADRGLALFSCDLFANPALVPLIQLFSGVTHC